MWRWFDGLIYQAGLKRKRHSHYVFLLIIIGKYPQGAGKSYLAGPN
jgi:hypothetical protein